MSFQHFRLGSQVKSHPLPPHLASLQSQQQMIPPGPQFQVPMANIPSSSPSTSASRAPYGSGDHDDGYSLIFPSLEAFHAWREQEEETQMVEFVKGDTHGSKAVPPRFKDHTKLVCARHSRSGRKKYVKKHPERVRKVPSRKIEGQGCSASISFKTYFDTDEVRANYNSQHSHEIGPANLPFTRRGRKAAVQQEKVQSKRAKTSSSVTPAPPSIQNSISAPTNFSLPLPFPQSNVPAPFPQAQFGYQQPLMGQQQTSLAASQERWDRMSVLFDSIRAHARALEYPIPSVAALESVLIRLYLESPMAGMPGGPGIPVSPPGISNVQPQMPPPISLNQAHNGHAANGGHITGVNAVNGTGVAGANGAGEGHAMDEDDNEEEDENGLTDDAE